MILGEPCPRCGGVEKSRNGDYLKCAPCDRARCRTRQSRRGTGIGLRTTWKARGWLSRQEALSGYSLAGAATACEACGATKSGHGSGRFVADHSDLRHGGTGRYRGALCQPCNLATGWMERHDWVGPDYLVAYLQRSDSHVADLKRALGGLLVAREDPQLSLVMGPLLTGVAAARMATMRKSHGH